jgi:PAS domain S-box-containing protein
MASHASVRGMYTSRRYPRRALHVAARGAVSTTDARMVWLSSLVHLRAVAVAFAAGLAAVLLLLWMSHRNAGRLAEAAAWRAHTDEVTAEAWSVLARVEEAETSGRGFVITGDERFLPGQAAVVARLQARIDRLRRLTADNPDQQRRLDRLAPLVQTRLETTQRGIALRRARGYAPAAALVGTLEGKRQQDAIRDLLTEMIDEENRLQAEREAAVRDKARRVDATLLGGALLASGLLVFAFVAVDRESRRRRDSEAEARRQAATVEDLYENAPCGYHSLGPDGTVLRMNATELRWLGYARDELVGRKRFKELLASESVARFEEAFPRFLATGAIRDLELELLCRDGGRIPVIVSASAVRDEAGAFVMSRSTVFDVSDRRRAETERDRFFELSSDLLCVCGLDGVFRRVNRSWEGALGYSREELTRTPFVELVHPEDREPTVAEFERQVQRGESVISFENRYRHKDGSWRWLQWSSMPDLPNQQVLAVARDVTEQRRRQDELLHAQQRAEAAAKELESFSYSVAHDLRSPLRSLDGFSQALLEDYGDALDETGRHYLLRIRNGAQRMGDLIDDLLTLSRITRAELVRQPVDLSALVRSVAEEVARHEPEREVEVTVADDARASADPRLLRVALENLLANAWKFTRGREPARVEFGLEDGGGTPAYFVRDNGVGFDMKYADKLFAPFQRLHSAREFEGTGVGLATVARVVRRHGRRVWAEAEPERGATFRFTLPDGPPPGATQEA